MGRLLALMCAVAGALDNTAHCPRAFVPARAGGFRMQVAPAQGCCVLGVAMSASIEVDAMLRCGEAYDDAFRTSGEPLPTKRKNQPGFYGRSIHAPLHFAREAQPGLWPKAQLCSLRRDRKWRLGSTVGSCCSGGGGVGSASAQAGLATRRKAYAACTAAHGGKRFEACLAGVRKHWKPWLKGADDAPPPDMQKEMGACRAEWHACVGKARAASLSPKCTGTVRQARKSMKRFEGFFRRCMFEKEQLDLLAVDPALWESEVALEHCENRNAANAAAKECRAGARVQYRALVATAMADHPACIRYGAGSGHLVQLDLTCMPPAARKALTASRASAMRKRAACEARVDKCFKKDEGAVAAQELRFKAKKVPKMDAVKQEGLIEEGTRAMRAACTHAIRHGLAAIHYATEAALDLYEGHPELMTTEASSMVDKLARVKLHKLERMLARPDPTPVPTPAPASASCVGAHAACQAVRMGGSGPQAQRKCKAYSQYGCLWLGASGPP